MSESAPRAHNPGTEEPVPQELSGDAQGLWDPGTVGLVGELLDGSAAGTNSAQGEAYLGELSAQVKRDEVHTGGHTIPGTDEWIPGKPTVSFRFLKTGPDGTTTAHDIPPDLATRLYEHAQKLKAATDARETAEAADVLDLRKIP
jgi:hypothetical protein